MRLLIAAVGSRGDVQPMVALGIEMQRRSHEVALAAPPDFVPWVRSFGLRALSLGSDMRRLVTAHGQVVQQGTAAVLRTVRDLLGREIDAQFRELRESLSGYDALLGAGGLLAGASVAEACGVPFGLVMFSPQYLRSALHPPPMTPWLSLPDRVNGLLWWGAHRLFDRAILPAMNRHRAELGLVAAPSFMAAFAPRHVVLPADRLVCAIPPDVRPTPEQTGFWALADAPPLSPELESFLSRGDPPVYVGFGSMPDADAERTTSALIEAASRCRVRLLLARGWAALARGALPSACFAFDEAPHRMLFSRVAAVVHHGGAGTLYEALRAGVPQVIVPHGMDQFYWAGRARALGVAPAPLRRTHLDASSLENRLTSVLREPSYRAAASRLALRISSSNGVAEGGAWVERTLLALRRRDGKSASD